MAPPTKRARTEPEPTFRLYGPRYIEVGAAGEAAVTRTRLACAQAVAALCARLQGCADGVSLATRELVAACGQNSATARTLCGLTCWFWGRAPAVKRELPAEPAPTIKLEPGASSAPGEAAASNSAATQLASAPTPAVNLQQRQVLDLMLQHLAAVSPAAPSPPSPAPYIELQPYYARLRQEFDGLVAQCRGAGIVPAAGRPAASMGVDELTAAARSVPLAAGGSETQQLLFALQQRVLASAAALQGLEAYTHGMATAAMASAVVQVRCRVRYDLYK